jgi:hypothetical protein
LIAASSGGDTRSATIILLEGYTGLVAHASAAESKARRLTGIPPIHKPSFTDTEIDHEYE